MQLCELLSIGSLGETAVDGQNLCTTSGSWKVPKGVNSICVVAVGRGGSYDNNTGLPSTGRNGVVRIIWGEGRSFPCNTQRCIRITLGLEYSPYTAFKSQMGTRTRV